MVLIRLALAVFLAALGTGLAVQRCPCVGGGRFFQVNGIWQKPLDSSSPLFPFWRGGLVGFINAAGVEVIAPQFQIRPESLRDFHEGLTAIGGSYIDESGVRTFSMAGQKQPFYEGLARVRRTERTDAQFTSYVAYVDRSGAEAFRLEDVAESADLSEGLAAFRLPTRWIDIDVGRRLFVAYPGGWGFVDKTGKVAIPAQFVEVGPFRGGLARAMADGYCYRPGFGDQRLATPTTGSSTCGLDAPEAAGQQCLVGFIDRSGVFAIDPKFEEARDFSEGLAAVRLNDLWGFLDEHGRVVIPPQFKSVAGFREGHAAVETESGWGLINREGRFSAPPRFKRIGSLSNGLAMAWQEGRTFYVDEAGVERLSGPWTTAGSFVRGLAMVRFADGDWAYINRSGKTVLRFNPSSPAN